MSIFSFDSSNIQVVFDKEYYTYGVDTHISWYLLDVERDEVSLYTETICWVSENKYDTFWKKPTYRNIKRSQELIVTKGSGYRFEFDLNYPNLDCRKDSHWIWTFTYVCNFLMCEDTGVIIPIVFPELESFRSEAKDYWNKVAWENITEEEVDYVIDSDNIGESFKKRSFTEHVEPGMIRLPWNLWDKINAERYFSIANSSLATRIAHTTYVYNIQNYLYIILGFYFIFFVVYSYKTHLEHINILAASAWVLIISTVVILILRLMLRIRVNRLKSYLILKSNNELNAILDNQSFTLADILEEKSNTPGSMDSWKITVQLYVFYHFKYPQWKYSLEHDELLFQKELIQKQFSSHAEILWFQGEIDGSNIFVKNRKMLEKVGIFVWLELAITYDQYPQKVYQLNLDRYIKTSF